MSKTPGPNFLSAANRFRLGTWMNEQARETLDGKSLNEVAAMAQAVLGFPVTGGNITSMAKALGVEWTRPASNSMLTDIARIREELAALSELVRELQQRVAALEQKRK